MNSGTDSGARTHPRTVGWFGTTAVAMGGINQSLFLIGALLVGQGAIPGQGSAAVPLLIAGLLLSWAATPGWTELILMYPNRVGGIAATCAEAFRPYSPVLANLTGVCYWWGWVPTCGLTALLSASAIHQWYLPWFPVPLMACGIVAFFTVISLCGVKWVMRFAMPLATASAILAFLSAVVPIFSGRVDWHQALTFHLTVPFPGWFGQVTSIMAGLYLVVLPHPLLSRRPVTSAKRSTRTKTSPGPCMPAPPSRPSTSSCCPWSGSAFSGRIRWRRTSPRSSARRSPPCSARPPRAPRSGS